MSQGDIMPGAAFLTRPAREFGKPVCRLGLASHGTTAITADDVLHAVARGVNFLNWSGFAEGPPDDEAFPAAVAALGRERDRVVVCVQFAARTAARPRRNSGRCCLPSGRTTWTSLTLYYVERAEEWDALCGPGGAVEYLRAAKADGAVRRLGVTSHQRPLAATMAASGLLDCVMVRYNAAHRGAEREVFPVDRRPRPAGHRLHRPPMGGAAAADAGRPARLRPAPAPAWYRFALQQPAVSVVLSAPHTRAELDEDLEVLSASGPLPAEEYEALARHGERVRAHAGRFA